MKHLGFFVFLLWGLLFVWAQQGLAIAPTVKLVVIPNVREINLEHEHKPLVMIARVNQSVNFQWELDGPGKLGGDTHSREVHYLPPDFLEQKFSEATVTVEVSTNDGETAHTTVTLRLLTSAERNITSPLGELLAEADSYFEATFFIEPEGKNAFEIYKKALEIEPENQHALNQLQMMLSLYKEWGLSSYHDSKFDKSQTYFQRYLYIADYLLQYIRNHEFEQEYQEVRQRLDEISVLLPQVTPTLTASPSSTPTSSPLPTPTQPPTPTVSPSPNPNQGLLSREDELLQQADVYFESTQYTTPQNANAFDLYKQVLTLAPHNKHAQQKIYEIADFYKTRGNLFQQKGDSSKARSYYQKYLFVAQYIVDRFQDREVRQIQENIRLFLQSPLEPTPEDRDRASLTEELERFKLALSEDLSQYKVLLLDEQRGTSIDEELIPLLEDILYQLKAIEKIYRESGDQAMLTRVESIEEARKTFEQELSERIGRK